MKFDEGLCWRQNVSDLILKASTWPERTRGPTSFLGSAYALVRVHYHIHADTFTSYMASVIWLIQLRPCQKVTAKNKCAQVKSSPKRLEDVLTLFMLVIIKATVKCNAT